MKLCRVVVTKLLWDKVFKIRTLRWIHNISFTTSTPFISIHLKGILRKLWQALLLLFHMLLVWMFYFILLLEIYGIIITIIRGFLRSCWLVKILLYLSIGFKFCNLTFLVKKLRLCITFWIILNFWILLELLRRIITISRIFLGMIGRELFILMVFYSLRLIIHNNI